MKFLIVYGTIEGQTKKIATFCASRISEHGHETDIRDSCDRMTNLEINSFDAIILAGSVHQKRHPEALVNFAIAHQNQIMKVPNLFISVSLSIAFKNGEAEAQEYVHNFSEFTNFKPDSIALVAGALKFDQYDYYMKQIIEHVVLEDREAIKGDREFTDWEALGNQIDELCISAK